MKKLLSVLLALVFVSGMAFASPFPDLPADHWATEAVNVLAEKGIVEGYPNGTFRGSRPATRYEVAMVVARVLAYLEKRPQVTREDLETIKRLVDEFKDELDALGVRVKNAEDLLASLEKRVTELERVRFSGGFETVYTTNLVSTCANCTMTPWQIDALGVNHRVPFGSLPNSDLYQYDSMSVSSTDPYTGDRNAIWDTTDLHNRDREQPDWQVEDYPFDKTYDAFPTRTGSALTDVGYLKVSAKLSPDYTAGGVISMYNDVGQLGNGLIYGVTPPTIANPFQAGMANNQTAGSAFFGTAATNLSVDLNQIEVDSTTQNQHFVAGDWRPALMSDNVIQGLPNMGIMGPDYLPFYGGQVYGKVGGNFAQGLEYEAAAGRLSIFAPALPSTGTNYENILAGGALGYDWIDPSSTLADVHLVGDFVRVMNDTGTGGGFGGINNIAMWAQPGNTGGWGGTPAPFTLNNGGTVSSSTIDLTGIGPQSENLWGAELRAKFGKNLKWLTAWGKYGNSHYHVSNGTRVPVAAANGSMFAGGVTVKKGRISGGGEYLWVEPTYDPFIAQIPVPTSYFDGPNPSIMWLGFPYPVTFSAPFTNLFGAQALTGANATTFGNSNTAGGGDVYYNIHDSRKYPQNRVGFRGNVNWDFGQGNVGGRGEYLQQTQVSTIGAELTPGFEDPLFPMFPTFEGPGSAGLVNSSAFTAAKPDRGYILDWTGYLNYTLPGKDLMIDGLYTDSRMKRFEPDFNNVSLHFVNWRGGLTYQPTDKWSILGGYSDFQSLNGRYLEPSVNQTGGTITVTGINAASAVSVPNGASIPPNMAFRQQGPYGGVDYKFAKGTDAWLMYSIYNMKDTSNTGFAGFNGTQLESGMSFTF